MAGVIPKKLKDDAIVEAVCQVQFTSADPPQVIIGRLSDFGDAGSYEAMPTPFADMPQTVRDAAANFRHLPVLQLTRSDGMLVQLGERVVSAHVVGANKYPGWEIFKAHLAAAVGQPFDKAKDPVIGTVTLRYINALVPSRHFVGGPHELNVAVTIEGKKFDGEMNLNFIEKPNDRFTVTTRIADTNFVQGTIPEDTSVVVDVEVSSGPAFHPKSKAEVLDWIEEAHTIEKQTFFRLLPPDAVAKLRED